MQFFTCTPYVARKCGPNPEAMSAAGNRAILKNILMRLHLITLLIILACVQVAAKGYAQRISLKVTDAPLKTILKSIEQQSGGYLFWYKDNLLQDAKSVTLNLKDVTLKDALDQVFKNQPLAYQIVDRTITLLKKETSILESLQQSLAPIEVTGILTNERGEPMVGTSVTVKGTTKGTITNNRGQFRINAEPSSTLVINSLGYVIKEIQLNGRTQLSINMEPSKEELDQVQVIGYGLTSQRVATGSINVVKSDQISRQPVSNPLLALQGTVPGLFVTQSTGFSTTGVTVRIRGQNSISNGNDPLYVIDGVPYLSQMYSSGGSIFGNSGNNTAAGGNPLTFINPADIETISILKDADATAIYGSKGANGVILITTKKGKSGKTNVDANIQNGWGRVGKKIDLLNSKQYLAMRHEAHQNDGESINNYEYDLNGLWDTTRNTDWQKELIGGTANYHDSHIGISGGSDRTMYYLGGGFHHETTVFPGDLSDNRVSAKFNINHQSDNKRFRLDFSSTYMNGNNRSTPTDLTQFAVRLAPVAPALFNNDGTLNWQPTESGFSSWENPLSYLKETYVNKTKNLVSNLFLTYKILPQLDLKVNLGYTDFQSDEVRKKPSESTDPYLVKTNADNVSLRTSTILTSNVQSWIVEPQISYSNRIGRGTLNAIVGSTLQNNLSAKNSIIASGFKSDALLGDLTSATNFIISSANEEYKYVAVFGRINYNWQEKYILNLTARNDGSSRFGPENQFHTFASGAVAWVFSKEKFFQRFQDIFSFGKLRTSYGTVGSDQIGNYTFLDLYRSLSTGVNYQGATGLYINKLFNPYLAWEETKKAEVALDLGFFKERILLSINYFENRSSNQIVSDALPSLVGYSSILRNLPATVKNSGVEISISSENVKLKSFSWSTNINFTKSNNKLLSYPGIEKTFTNLIIGEPITTIKKFKSAGVNIENGLYQFLNAKGEITTTPSISTDQISTVNTAPKYFGGVQNSIKFKNLQLDFLFQFVKQIGVNYYNGFYPGNSGMPNQPIYVLNRWRSKNQIGDVMKFTNGNLQNYTDLVSNSDGIYTDASYIRLKNIELSWSLPNTFKRRLSLSNMRLYVHAQNLLTITSFKGGDPETQNVLVLPPLRVVTVGAQITF
jgi:TonB-linked SusC/RagA family outer membrane protein